MTTVKCPTKVAILMAAYNGEFFIADQIDSIINQDCNDWTLYIRDDGSKDKTTVIIDKYVKLYPNIIRITDIKTNGGLTENFLSLLKTVHSRYYMFADQDDIWDKNKVSLSLSEIESINSTFIGPILIGSHYLACDHQMQPICPSFWNTHFGYEKMLNYNISAVQCAMAGADMIFNDALKQLIFTLPSNRLYYDHWVLLVALKHKAYVGVIPKMLRRYRQHESNVIGANIGKHNTRKQINRFFADYGLLQEIEFGSLIKYLYYRIKAIIMVKTAKKI